MVSRWISGALGWLVAVSLMLLSGSGLAQISLDGAWEWQVSDESTPPDDGSWETVQLPGCLYGIEDKSGWLRITTDIPTTVPGQRIWLRMRSVRYAPEVWVNGILVTTPAQSWALDLETDITQYVVPGESAIIAVRVHDWTRAVLSPSPIQNLSPGEDPRDVMTNRVLAPFPGDFLCFGITDSAWLDVESAIHVDEVRGHTSLLAGMTQVRLRLRNHGTETVQVRLAGTIVSPDEVPMTSFSRDNILVAPGDQELLVPLDWTPDDPWSPHSPESHRLDLEIRLGGTLVLDDEFALPLREVRTSGTRLILNGESAVLRCWDAPIPGRWYSAEEAGQVLQQIRNAGWNCVVLTGGIWNESWFEAADGLGLALILSTALGCDSGGRYRLSGDEFFQNMLYRAQALGRRASRHPAVVGINLASGASRCLTPQRWELLRPVISEMLAVVRLAAPGHWFTVRNETDFDDVSAVWLDFPFDPVDCLTGAECREIDSLVEASTSGAWSWQKIDPLWFSALPATIDEIDALTGVVGSAGRFDPLGESWELVSEFLAGQMATLVRNGVTAVSPENPECRRLSLKTLGEGLTPPDWLPASAESGLFRHSGMVQMEHETTQEIEFGVVAMGLGPLEGTVRVEHDGSLLAEQPVVLEPGEYQTLETQLSAPLLSDSSVQREFQVSVSVVSPDDQSSVARDFPFVVVGSSESGAPSGTVGVFDPLNSLPDWESGDADIVTLDSLLSVTPEMDVVVIGEDALSVLPVMETPSVYRDNAQFLLLYVDGGGRLVVFPQSDFQQVLPFAVAQRSLFFGFVDRNHPVTDGFSNRQFVDWKPGTPILKSPLVATQWGAFRCLLSGGRVGYEDLCALAFVRRG